MQESVLKSLMRLFAIVAQIHSDEEQSISRNVVEDYLKLVIRKDQVSKYLIMYDFYHSSLREREIKTGDKQLSLLSVKAVIICEQVNTHLDRKNKIYLLTQILQILAITGHKNEEDIDFVKTIVIGLKIDEGVFFDCKNFIFDNHNDILDKQHVLYIDNRGPASKFKYLYKEFISGRLCFLYIPRTGVCLFRSIIADDQLYFNDGKLIVDKTYIFEKGGLIKSPLIGSIYFNDVLKIFLQKPAHTNLYLIGENVSYKFQNSENGIKPFSFSQESGQLVGIMGSSGVGKSTLLNILNGSLKPETGKVTLNGYDIYQQKKLIEGLIGYVPQEDMLIEELTVYQNLYFNTRFYFKGISQDDLQKKVSRMLNMMGLYDIKDLKVGNTLNKSISGGQRKRLNIALELIREPQLLFVDEPTSGLSSHDSDLVIDLLKKQSLTGKLVIINIHQPSSNTYKELDKLILMDRGGRIIYHGNPNDTLFYLKSYQRLINADEGECPTCGNLDSEQLLQLIETKKVSDFGDITNERLVSPEEWHRHFQVSQNSEVAQTVELKLELPAFEFKTPGKLEQFRIYFLRNLISKLADLQYLILNLIEAPVLAFVLGWFTRYNAGTDLNPDAYIFSKNINLPVYLFMSVIVALFLGLMISSQEIYRDKKILKRESFLNLNLGSYYNSKLTYISVVLGVQMFLFVIIGNYILGIKGMFLQYWLLLWMLSILSGTIGLILSAALKSLAAIYIMIPILLIPQILLGGAMIKFDKLNSSITNTRYVPIVGDLMPSRWAYEALVVYQAVNNRYDREMYDNEYTVSNASFTLNYYIPELSNILAEIKNEIANGTSAFIVDQKVKLLFDGVVFLSSKTPDCKLHLSNLDSEVFNIATQSVMERFINCSREYYIRQLENAITSRDQKFLDLEKQLHGKQNLLDFKEAYHNNSLSDLVTNKNEPEKIEISKGYIIRKADPIYHLPESKLGRSHFFAPVKRVSDYYVDTFYFNLLVLILYITLAYLILITDSLHSISKMLIRIRGIISRF